MPRIGQHPKPPARHRTTTVAAALAASIGAVVLAAASFTIPALLPSAMCAPLAPWRASWPEMPLLVVAVLPLASTDTTFRGLIAAAALAAVAFAVSAARRQAWAAVHYTAVAFLAALASTWSLGWFATCVATTASIAACPTIAAVHRTRRLRLDVRCRIAVRALVR